DRTVADELFMANRTHLKKGEDTSKLISEIRDLLKSSKEIRKINNEKAQSLLNKSDGNDEELIKDLMSSLPVDKDVLGLLKKDGNLDFLKSVANNSFQNKSPISKIEEKNKLNRYPSIFKIKNQKNGKTYKTIPLNSHGYVDFETDVENDYLFRPLYKGKLKIEILQRRPQTNKPVTQTLFPPEDVSDILNITEEGPINGNIRLIIKPNAKAKVGDEISIKTSLSHPGGEFECVFDVKVDEKISNPKKKEKSKPNISFPNPPKLIKAYQHPEKEDVDILCWNDPKLNWNGEDIVKVILLSDLESDSIVNGIIINMDSFTLKRFLSKNKIKSTKNINFYKRKYYTTIYLHTLFLYSIFYKMSNDKNKKHNMTELDLNIFISDLIKPYSNFLIYESLQSSNNTNDDE
ncbi:MAG: hypothetical protein ACJ0PV_03890, partial [Flavobacteriaceae bacterium]